MFSSVVNTALIYQVPLIVWGEDIAFEFGGLQRSDSKPSAIAIDKSDLVKNKTVLDWLDKDISERDVFFYKYPDYEKTPVSKCSKHLSWTFRQMVWSQKL
jgi:hypothetical protein